MKKTNNSDAMLSGSISKSILNFFFPILIGTFFQQLYNTVDAVIVGRYAGTAALSSVGGSSGVIINLVVGFFTGLSNGCTVLISQYFGAKNQKKLEDSIHTAYAFAIAGGIFFGVLGMIFTPSLLRLMNLPEELMVQSTRYLTIYFAGLVFVFIYNMGASILRALGDSKRPLLYLIICTIINIILDIVLVKNFGMDVVGVAIATVISQAISSVLVTECLMHRTSAVKLLLKRIRFDKNLFIKMLKIGLPTGIQSSTYSISNMVIQSSINLFGVNTVAGWTAESKVDVIFWMINGSFGTAAATFVGQNFGAGNMERVKRGTRTCLLMSLGTAVFISAALYFFGRYPLMLFTSETEVIEIGNHFIQLIVPTYFVFVFIEIFSASLRARGDTLITTICNLTGIVLLRVIWISIFGHKGNVDLVIICYPVSWVVTAIMISAYYFFKTRKQNLIPSAKSNFK